MRKVVDSNYLQSEKLQKYLSSSSQNHAVLTDYAAMEAYKGDTLASIYRSMDILSRYPRQVIVLKPTEIVCGLRGRSAGLQKRLIDERQTSGFGKYCRNLRAAKDGNASLQTQLLELGKNADLNMDKILADAAGIPDSIDEIAKSYNVDELRVFRKGEPLTKEMAEKFVKSVLEVAAHLFADHPRVAKLPDAKNLPNTFIFRAALCAYLMALSWVSVGGATNTKPEKLRNDVVDISFAAYATFFNGLLTEDKKLDKIYQQAASVLPMLIEIAK